MADQAHVQTDKILEEIEKKIEKEYKKAHKEVTAKMDDYLARFVTKDKKWQEWVANGSKTQAEYKQWKKGQVLMGQRWGELKDSLAQDYANAAKISRSIANGYRPEVYALNHNYATFDIEKKSQLDTSYTLYSRESVERMYRDNPRLYHKPGQTISQEIKEGKLARWDKRRIQSVITQGILQGESIPQLTKRLEQVTGGDHKAAIRNIRTMMTGVQNAGRIDAQERAKKMGIPVQKQWMATLDSRTRHWHRDLDGVAVDLDEPFENDMGKIMFPGDPDADPANIYNCRCTLLSAIKGHEIDLSDTSLRHDKNLGKMSYDEWKDAKAPVTSNPITLPEEKAASIRQRYINEYAGGHGVSGGPHRYTAEEGQRLMDEWVRENGGHVGRVDAAINKLDDLWREAEDTDLGRYIGPEGQKAINPLKLGTQDELKEIRKVKRQLSDQYSPYYYEDEDIVKAKKVNVGSLRTDQPYVEHDATERYIRQMADGQVPSSPLGMRDAVAIKYDGEYWVIDGNHRMAAAKLLDLDSVEIKVIDADAMGIRRKKKKR